MNNHTFLYNDGLWIVTGGYWDENGVRFESDGETRVIHTDGLWFIKGIMHVHSNPPTEYDNQYEVDPFLNNFPTTVWVSHSPVLGQLKGTFTVVEKAILSSFAGEDPSYTGFEFFMKIDNATYYNEGAFYKGKRRLSSWALTMKKTD